MKRYVLKLAYDGGSYAGWQVQPHASTVAGTLEGQLARLVGEPVRVVGAGRTDAGVHAWGQVAHWDTAKPLPKPFLSRLNALLPGDIRALALYEAAPDFHARHSALSRTYRYWLRTYPNPFLRAYSLEVPPPLDRSCLEQAAALLVGEHDFAAFGKEVGRYAHTRCQVVHASWVYSDGLYEFRIEANRFLRAMVRALVGAQVRLAQGRLSWERFQAALFQQDRRWGLYLAPPQGLFLWEVAYPPNSLYLLERYEFLPTAFSAGAAPTAAPKLAPDSTGAPPRGAQ